MPEDVHEELRRRAKARRMTVRDYVLELIERDARRMTLDEWFDRLAARPPRAKLAPGEIAELVREEREDREAELERRLGRLGDRPGADQP